MCWYIGSGECFILETLKRATVRDSGRNVSAYQLHAHQYREIITLNE